MLFATQAQMLKSLVEKIFQGRIIEVHIGTLLSDQALLYWLTAEMKAKASICISNDETLIESLKFQNVFK